MTEIWRPIPEMGHRYEASDQGRIRSNYGGKLTILKPRPVGRYFNLRLRPRAQVAVWKLVHQWVAITFIGPPRAGFEINHKDGDPSNNAVGNLEYVTPKENCRHAMLNGLTPNRKGENCGTSLLTVSQVMDIKYLLSCGVQAQKIGAAFGVSKSCVNNIRSGARWADVPMGPATPRLLDSYRGPCMPNGEGTDEHSTRA